MLADKLAPGDVLHATCADVVNNQIFPFCLDTFMMHKS